MQLLEANPPKSLQQSGIEIVTDPTRFRTLKPQWDALWLEWTGDGVFQSFDCCLNAWETIAEPAGHKLFCLVGWQEGRMIAIWPLTTYRKLLWKFTRPLDASGAEFTEVLISDTIDQQRWISTAWQIVSSKSKSHIVVLPYIRSGTPLNAVLSSVQSATIHRDVAPYAHLKDEQDWPSYYNSLSKSNRINRARKERRLAELGNLHLEVITAGDQRCPELITWMLAQKRFWAERTGKKGFWLYSERYRDFLTRLLMLSSAMPKPLIMCLTLDGAPIAVAITVIGKHCLEELIMAFDAGHEKHSPGMLLMEHFVKWALEHKLDVDFGNGGERSKTFWSRNYFINTATYHIALSPWGRLALYLRTARRAPDYPSPDAENTGQLPSGSQP